MVQSIRSWSNTMHILNGPGGLVIVPIVDFPLGRTHKPSPSPRLTAYLAQQERIQCKELAKAIKQSEPVAAYIRSFISKEDRDARLPRPSLDKIASRRKPTERPGKLDDPRVRAA